jgi:hypothetical protein
LTSNLVKKAPATERFSLVRQRREGRYPCCGIGKRTGEFRWAGKRHPVGRRRVLINQSGETLGLTVRFAPKALNRYAIAERCGSS